MEGSIKLIGEKYSPAVQEVLLVIRLANAPVQHENLPWTDVERREELKSITPTGTFPCLQTSQGVISESRAIIQYIAETYKPELLGANSFEKAQVRQWVEFGAIEMFRVSKSVIFPIFGFVEYNKADYDKGINDIKEHLKLLNKHLEGKTHIVGSNVTVADVTLFGILRHYFMLLFPEPMRKTLFPHVTTWLVNIGNSEAAQRVYGRLTLCKVPAKPFIGEKKEEKPKAEKPKEKTHEGGDEEEEKPKKKAANPLDLLPPTTFDLDAFKRDFLNTDDKKGAMERFWSNFDPNGFSFWWMQYQKLPSEGQIFFKTNNSSNFFLQKVDNFRKYTFAVHGVYGVEGNYEVRGLWMWRGLDVPEEMKSHDSFPYMTIKKLDPSNPAEKALIEEYWLNLTPGNVVDGLPVCEVSYFK